ncbi:MULTISPECIES: MurR/RpiR family transcriptional regulator [Vibrio]|jgi:DNA-binding MurR/RpiR family transcriptional regulator|uniref:Helix-turn-helix domain, rpiR family protein n=4 Tax=Vibrio harveyi group TaxID=717610 RepID=K5UV50_VIBHA|nr:MULTISPECIES: MurR/RpiR family transcriptional regulator [Vibrio]EMR37383.1 transcriptional regulator [Vibrio harveyi CAIM 1792]AIV07815.1 transcriptional regulator [Vibrio harveyi]AMF99696.1 MurR/RpiR family transcriptional regulator [Vibrio harveyi]APP08924.1 transcriptional regulator [Vibrio harveyi]APX08000.1 MurR/RpiR family transcriptional regulator [Vibrio campbellii]
MDVEVKAPADLDTLKELIAKRYDSLSGRLQQVADFVTDQPMLVAVETMATIAKQANVPLSTLSRFSNAMGFDGFTSMQVLFRDQYLNRPRDYKERVRKAREMEDVPHDSPQAIFQDFGHANIEALEQLQMSVSPQKLERAVALMDGAETIYIQGTRRAYPVAFYLWYALMKSDKSVVLLDDHGGMLSPLTRRMNEKDVLFAITFNPYAEETSQLIDDACKKNVPIVCITDNQMTPHGSKMDVCFEVQEGELMGFRSLSSSMYLAQAIAVSLICREVK